jgi:AcrR family transcriptional regulator
MPRAYRLGERAAAMEATRTRILEAAIELYMERGISATTMREIGERADVAPGTLRHRFPTKDALDAAMVERLRAEAPLPPAGLLDGVTTTDARLALLLRAAVEFFAGAARLYRMWLREPMLAGPWLEAGREYGECWDRLIRQALGPLADDAESMAVVRAVMQPAFFAQLAGAARSREEAADLAAGVIGPWLAARAQRRSS